ncbi:MULTISPECIES: hypothetical protein [unclassified Sphingopyxis]
MRHAFRTAVAVTALLGIAHDAQAQGFFKRLADRAIEEVEQQTQTVIRDTIENGIRGGDRKEAEPDEAPLQAQSDDSPGVEAPPPAAPALPKAPAYIDGLNVPADVEVKKAAYNKFGEVNCSDCEGGIDFDGRPQFPYDQFSGQYGERAKRAGSWSVGHVHRWQGKASTGTLTVLREEEVDGFRCRRLEYRLMKGSASTSRPGLICWGLANRSSEIENWHEIY